MSRTPRSLSRAGALALCAALLGLSSVAHAASINYGDRGPVPPGIMFTGITESSTDPVPLYGPPSAFTTGLDFDPTSFAASGAAGTGDLTDGQLNFGVMGDVTPATVTSISAISLTEAGDYTLVGFGTTATQVFAGASMRVKVTHIDGVDVPDVFIPQSNASFGANLVANPGILQPWGLGLFVDIEGYLTSNMVPFDFGATKVEVVIDNLLIALSEPASAASIVKKEFVIDIVPEVGIIPEPATLALAGMALCFGLVAARKRG